MMGAFMQVKKFEATTMRDAVTAVKRELGPNAVILATKEIPPTGDGLPKLYEVTAASAVTSKPGAESKASPPTPYQSSFSDGEMTQKISHLQENMATARQARLIEGAIYDIKNMMTELIREVSVGDNIAPHIFAIDRSLAAAGIDRGIIAELRRHLQALPSPSEINRIAGDNVEQYYLENASRWLIKRVKIAPKWTNTAGITNIHMILGTPGCGKSTLVSKIATAVAKKDKHKVAILSWDPEKLGATEQTRVYSKILGIEHYTISRPEELNPMVLKLRGTDLLLVDTAGRNPVDTQSLVDLELVKNQGLSIEFHLALSATEKPELQNRAIRHFSTIGITSVAFTKLDEIPAWGDIFNATCKWSLPLSWITMSQAPSDQPMRAGRDAVVEQLFKMPV
jgi:flagellar biosynthesis protein FlhF